MLEVWDWKRNGQHKLLGEARTSTDELLRGAEAGTVRLELQCTSAAAASQMKTGACPGLLLSWDCLSWMHVP